MRDLFGPVRHESRSGKPFVLSMMIHLALIPLAILIGQTVMTTTTGTTRPPDRRFVRVYVPASSKRSRPGAPTARPVQQPSSTTNVPSPAPLAPVRNIAVGLFDLPTSKTNSPQSDARIFTGAFDLSSGQDGRRATGGGKPGPANTFDPGAAAGAGPGLAAQVEPAELLSAPAPAYTEDARQRRITGKVVIKVKLCANGEVEVLDVIAKLDDGLDQAAIDAVKKLRIKPARVKGVPTDVIGRITVVFALT
jgi:TonB family protein